MQETLIINLIKTISARIDSIVLIFIILSILNLICLVFCIMVYWTQRKRINTQIEILNNIKPALSATIRNRKDITKLSELYSSMPPEKVRMDIIKKLDLQHKANIHALERGIKKMLSTLNSSI